MVLLIISLKFIFLLTFIFVILYQSNKSLFSFLTHCNHDKSAQVIEHIMNHLSCIPVYCVCKIKIQIDKNQSLVHVYGKDQKLCFFMDNKPLRLIKSFGDLNTCHNNDLLTVKLQFVYAICRFINVFRTKHQTLKAKCLQKT